MTTSCSQQQEIPTTEAIVVDSATIANIIKEVNLVTEEEDTTCIDVTPAIIDTLCSGWIDTVPRPTPVKHVKDDVSTSIITSSVKATLPVKITKSAPKQAEKPKVQKKQAAQATLHIYIVEKGDTFYSIARKLNVDVKRLREFNPGMYKVLEPGNEIRYWKTIQ